jgi:phage terminase large subunit-like protein
MSIPLEFLKLTEEQIAELPPLELAKLIALLDAEQKIQSTTVLYRLFPETGPLSRHKYPKHMEFFKAGAKHQERAFIAANRVGKTMAACYELSCHLTGYYPKWWEGRKFYEGNTAWASGEDSKSVRESLQQTLLGKPGEPGTGLLPAESIINITPRAGVPDAVDIVTVKHSSGGTWRLVFKSYDQGRESFQASKVAIVLFDEEPPLQIYTEGLTRTMSTVPGQPSGIVMSTFTPLKGLSGVVLSFMPGGQRVEGEIAN